MSSPLALAIASTSQDPSLFETVVVRKGDGGTLKLTVQQLQKMTWTELSSIWKVRTVISCHLSEWLTSLGRQWILVTPFEVEAHDATFCLQEYINAIAMALVTSNNSLDGISGQRLQVQPLPQALHCRAELHVVNQCMARSGWIVTSPEARSEAAIVATKCCFIQCITE